MISVEIFHHKFLPAQSFLCELIENVKERLDIAAVLFDYNILSGSKYYIADLE
jgi:hypothetical protein